jgi:hypothetical protein
MTLLGTKESNELKLWKPAHFFKLLWEPWGLEALDPFSSAFVVLSLD